MVNTGLEGKKVAIVYPMAIGDGMLAMPTFHSFKAGLPESKLVLVTQNKQAPLAKCLEEKLFDNVVVLDRRIGIRGIWDVKKELSKLGVDVYINLAGNDKSGMILAGMIGEKIGPAKQDYSGNGIVGSWMYTPFAEQITAFGRPQHRVDQLLEFAEYFGLEKKITFEMHLPEFLRDAAERLIERYSLRDGKVVALNVGASVDSKRWPGEYFRVLAELLVKDGYRVVIIGAKSFSDGNYDKIVSDRFFSDRFVDNNHCVNLINDGHSTPYSFCLLRDSYLLRYAGVFATVVGCDTGPMHIAGSVGEDAQNKTISLFGPTNPRIYGVYDGSGRFNILVKAPIEGVVPLECLPERNEKYCNDRKFCSHKTCMVEIEPEEVAETVVRQTS
jgi:heptosyltransferase-2